MAAGATQTALAVNVKWSDAQLTISLLNLIFLETELANIDID